MNRDLGKRVLLLEIITCQMTKCFRNKLNHDIPAKLHLYANGFVYSFLFVKLTL